MVDKITSAPSDNELIGKVNEIIDGYITTDTNQDITGTKTFIGEKKINFKQSTASTKLGFTLYSNTGTELGAFELRPNTINGKPILTLNSQSKLTAYVGFRYWGNSINILAPQPAMGNYFITIGVTDGTNTVTTTDNGILNISSLLPTVPTNVSAFTNDAGYITSSALSPYVLSSNLAAVATSGSYADLNNKPTIPTVNNPTITFIQGGTTKGTITLNQSSAQTIAFDADGGTVDNALSLTSENPVQNKVVTQALTELSANVNMDAYLDMIISGNYSSLPMIMQSQYSSDLDDIIGGTYDNNS